MSEFKVGDLVKRISGSWRGMDEGDTSRVTEAEGYNVMLEDFPGITFDSRKFVLVEATAAHQGVRGFKVGDRVRMINEDPAYGSGEVEVGHIGVVTRVNTDNSLVVDFPAQSAWNADECDLEHVDQLPETTSEVSLDEAVANWQTVNQQIKELELQAANYIRVMRRAGLKPV